MLVTALPAFLHGMLESAGDRDVFRFATGSGTLLNAGSAQLASNDDSGSGNNFSIEVPVIAGVHYIEVRGFSTGTTGSYTSSIEFVGEDGTGVTPLTNDNAWDEYPAWSPNGASLSVPYLDLRCAVRSLLR